jgi:diphosphomevalonate decarboxylase
MNKLEVVERIFHHNIPQQTSREKGLAFAPTNIALCKYWGKRDAELNLPINSSLSISLPDKGALTNLVINHGKQDNVTLNNVALDPNSAFVTKIVKFLNLFRPRQEWFLDITIQMNLPVAAGLASSACGFAALVLALKDLFVWHLSTKQLSILARLGSGSAARSLWNGFVEWHAGGQADGMDSFAESLPYEWPQLCIGILSISNKEKPIPSREAMQRTVNTSLLYSMGWTKKVLQDIIILKQSLNNKNFSLLGGTAESNALSMHATMLSSWPPICYFLPGTITAMQQVWELRKSGLEVYFTEDAGPNLKLIFLDKDKDKVERAFENLEVIKVFD